MFKEQLFVILGGPQSSPENVEIMRVPHFWCLVNFNCMPRGQKRKPTRFWESLLLFIRVWMLAINEQSTDQWPKLVLILSFRCAICSPVFSLFIGSTQALMKGSIKPLKRVGFLFLPLLHSSFPHSLHNSGAPPKDDKKLPLKFGFWTLSFYF